MKSTNPVLSVEGLAKSFGDIQAVRDVSFEIHPGETYGLLGPNGAGKTTSISMIVGILDKDRGSVLLRGRPVSPRSTDVRVDIGFVPQDLAIYPDLTAKENLMFFGRLYGMKGDALKSRLSEVLDVVGLLERANDRAGEFSGGMKRRLNIAIGLLHHPHLLVLDEPTGGVDPPSRNAILESVEALSREGMAVLYTTHYMEEAERLCNRVGIIDGGELKAEGTQRDLVSMVGGQSQIQLTVSGDLESISNAVAGLARVSAASVKDGGIQVVASDAGRALSSILAAATEAGGNVSGIDVSEPDLEAVFLHLTGKALRD